MENTDSCMCLYGQDFNCSDIFALVRVKIPVRKRFTCGDLIPQATQTLYSKCRPPQYIPGMEIVMCLFMVSKNEVIRSHVLAFTTNTTIKNLQIRVDDGNREKEKQQQRNVNQVYQIIYTLHRKGKISFSSFYIHWLRQNISFSTQLHPMLICQLSDIC